MLKDGKVASEKTSLKDAANIEYGSSEEEEEVVEEKTRRQKIAHFLQSNAVQYTVIAMVVLDGIIVLLELIIDFGIIKFPDEGGHDTLNSTHYNSTHLIPEEETTLLPDIVIPETHHNNGGHHHVKHHGRHHNHHNDYSIVTQTIATVTQYLLNSTDEYGNFSVHGDGHHDDHHGGDHHGGDHHGAHHHSTKEKVEHMLHHASLLILCLFMVEVIVKVYAEGKHLLKHKAEVLDAFVVVISFTLDVVFTFVDVNQAAKDASGLMVMLRLWRVTRLINGVIISVQMEADKKIHKIEMVLKRKERENEHLRDKLALLQEEVQMLKDERKKLEDKNKGGTPQSPLLNLSQKTDADINDILMGWDSPQFLNSQSVQTTTSSSSSSSSSSTSTSTVSAPAGPLKDTKSSSSPSTKSMFMVFEDDKKDESSAAPIAHVIGPKPPVFVVPVDEGSPKHTASNVAYEEENHPHQILHLPQHQSSKENHPPISSIQPYNPPNYPVPETTNSKKKVVTSPTQPMAPIHVTGNQPITGKHSIASQYSPPSSSVDIPRKVNISPPAVQKKESAGNSDDFLRPEIPHHHLVLSDPQLNLSSTPPAVTNTQPTNGKDQVIPLIPPPASKRGSEGRKKSVSSSYSSGQQAPVKSTPKSENSAKSPVDVLPPDTKATKKPISVQSPDDCDVPTRDEHPSPPGAIILPPVSSVAARTNGQNSGYTALVSPRQPSPPVSENVFFEIDDSSTSSSFLGDAMSGAPAEKDPGAPR